MNIRARITVKDAVGTQGDFTFYLTDKDELCCTETQFRNPFGTDYTSGGGHLKFNYPKDSEIALYVGRWLGVVADHELQVPNYKRLVEIEVYGLGDDLAGTYHLLGSWPVQVGVLTLDDATRTSTFSFDLAKTV